MAEGLVGTYLLAAEHADAIQRLAADPAIAATTRIPHPYPANGARLFIEQQIAARMAGTAWTFAILDRRELVGLCGVQDVRAAGGPELGYWIGKPYWGKGYASFGVKMVLEFVFTNLQLERVRAFAHDHNTASRRVLEKNGFHLLGLAPNRDPAIRPADAIIAEYGLTRTRWREARDGSVLARLHPALRAILVAELAAGNEVAETGGGWPDPDSVFVRLRDPFHARPDPLPDGLTYNESGDPHWWRADYCSLAPRHILAC